MKCTGSGVKPIIFPKEVKGIAMAHKITKMVAPNKYLLGRLTNMDLLVLITNTTKAAEHIDSRNHPVLKSEASAFITTNKR